MSEKLDLDALARLASGSHVSGYNAVEAKDVLRLIARIRALESRTSQNDVAYMNGWNDCKRTVLLKGVENI